MESLPPTHSHPTRLGQHRADTLASTRQGSHKTSLSIGQFCMASGAAPRLHPETLPSLLIGEMAERKIPNKTPGLVFVLATVS